MTLRYADSFAKYANNTQLNTYSTTNCTFNSGTGHDGNANFCEVPNFTISVGELRWSTDGGPGAPSIAQGDSIHFAGWLKIPTLHVSGNMPLIRFWNAAGTLSSVVSTDAADGKLQVHSFNNTFLAKESTASIAANTWYHIEARYVPDTSAGIFQVWVDGTQVINFSGNTIAGSYSTITRVTMCGLSSYHSYWDDVVCWDQESGSDFNYDHLDVHYIDVLNPDANGTTNDFTPSTGSNYQNVDDDPGYDTTTYNTASSNGQVDLYSLGDITTDEDAGIRAVKVVVRTGLQTSGSAGATIKARFNDTNDDAWSYSETSTGYVSRRTQFYERNPVTAELFAFSDVNDMELGVSRDSGSQNLRITHAYAEVVRGGAPYTPPTPSGSGGVQMFIPTI